MKKPRCEEESANRYGPKDHIHGPKDHRYGPEA